MTRPGPSPFQHLLGYDVTECDANFMAERLALLFGRGPRVTPDFCGSSPPATAVARSAFETSIVCIRGGIMPSAYRIVRAEPTEVPRLAQVV
ncbi:MAG: hypothetical protein RL701_5095, partial [Pseudomonadota bacterium]